MRSSLFSLNNPILIPNNHWIQFKMPRTHLLQSLRGYGKDQAHPSALQSQCSALLLYVKISVGQSVVFGHIPYVFIFLFSKFNHCSSVIISVVARNTEMVLLCLLSERPWPLTKPLSSPLPTLPHSFQLRGVHYHQVRSYLSPISSE